jgi:Lsr2
VLRISLSVHEVIRKLPERGSSRGAPDPDHPAQELAQHGHQQGPSPHYRRSHRSDYQHFGLDGTDYEIDLNTKHAQEFRDALARYLSASRRVGSIARRPARSGRSAPTSGLNTTEVREWAKTQGIGLKDRGRVPAELVVKFKAATGK